MAYKNETGLPSVTNILKPWIDTQWFTAESCHRGNQVHEQVSSHLLNEFFVCQKEYEVYYESFKKFEPRIKTTILVEERLADYKYGFCGQPDIVFVDSEDNVITLGDWKTSVAVAKYYQLQLGGYSILLRTQKDIFVNKLMLIRLRKELDKNPLINVYSVEDCERLFLNQLELFKLLGGKT
jgi:hypothetical protein